MTATNPHAVNAPTTVDPATLAAWSAETARAVAASRDRKAAT